MDIPTHDLPTPHGVRTELLQSVIDDHEVDLRIARASGYRLGESLGDNLLHIQMPRPDEFQPGTRRRRDRRRTQRTHWFREDGKIARIDIANEAIVGYALVTDFEALSVAEITELIYGIEHI